MGSTASQYAFMLMRDMIVTSKMLSVVMRKNEHGHFHYSPRVRKEALHANEHACAMARCFRLRSNQ